MKNIVLTLLTMILAAGMTAARTGETPNQGISAPQSPFGIGSCYTNNRSAEDNARWIPQMAAIGITNERHLPYRLGGGRAGGRQMGLGGAGQADELPGRAAHRLRRHPGVETQVE